MSIRLGFTNLAIVLTFLSAVSCKKEKIDQDKPKPTTDRAELTKDSIFLYAKQVYYWNNYLPSYSVFNPRSFTRNSNQLDNFNDELLKITRYTNYENWYDSDGGLYDEPKYSYIDDSNDDGIIARKAGETMYVELDGYGNDVGLGFAYVGSEYNYQIYVKYVSPGSSAYDKKIKRGSIVKKVNGRAYGSNFNAEIDLFLNAMDGATVNLNVLAPGETVPKDLVLSKMRYKSSPVLKDTVYVRGTQKIGYLAYARFSHPDDSGPALQAAFEKFQNQGVNNLIVDLRYNGGGYVATAEKLINYIVPSQHNGKLMFTEYYNETMRTGKADLLKNQFYEDGGRNKSYFGSYDNMTSTINKGGTNYIPQLERVVFIVSESTASASELTINSLKPYTTVSLVGEKTYGKPVGFFPIRIDKYDIYYAMFESKNSLGEGGYFTGMNVDVNSDDYPYNKELGDPTEINTSVAIQQITEASSSLSSRSLILEKPNRLQTRRSLKKDGFKGMIETPDRIQK
ncbi:S41 family peptidase [Pseudopedobacter beijingensis]|uniref:S41 family peptidase n=1 Tax=Pseudopedobacter beijingensis TaxID=1207056 RepID=A0ABW4IGS8_9SPHI